MNQSVISRGLRREGEAPAEPKIPAPGCQPQARLGVTSPSRISLTLPKAYLGILVLGQDSDKSHFGSHPAARAMTGFFTILSVGQRIVMTTDGKQVNISIVEPVDETVPAAQPT